MIYYDRYKSLKCLDTWNTETHDRYQIPDKWSLTKLPHTHVITAQFVSHIFARNPPSHLCTNSASNLPVYSEKTLVGNPSARRRCAICIFCQSKRELGCFSGKSDWNQHHQLTFGQVWPEKLMAGAFPHLLTTALLIYNAHRWACKDKYKHKKHLQIQRQFEGKKCFWQRHIPTWPLHA